MAIISSFELLLKPIAPQGGPATEIARDVIQGYFLQISNLEDRDIKLIFRTRTSLRQSGDSVNTELTDTNHGFVYDITEDNNIDGISMIDFGETKPGNQIGRYVNCLVLPCGQTASIAVLPNVQALLPIPNPSAPPASADMAVRGYTELVLSSDLVSASPLSFSAPRSARVLVSAEHRATFVDSKFDPSLGGQPQAGLDFDQTAYSLIPANGQALQVLNTHAPFNDPFQDCITSDFGSTVSLPDEEDEGEAVSLARLSRRLSPTANSPMRSTTFKVGSVPVQINYAIEDGKFVVDERSVNKAINRYVRRKRLDEEAQAKVQGMGKMINAALSGDHKADKEVQQLLKQYLK